MDQGLLEPQGEEEQATLGRQLGLVGPEDGGGDLGVTLALLYRCTGLRKMVA